MDIFSSVPDCDVVFFTYPNEVTYSQPNAKAAIQPTDPKAFGTNTISASDDIIDCTTSKGKGGAGNFTITLSSAKNYKSLLEPGAWCMIYMSDQKLTGKRDNIPGNGLKMLGIVRSVRHKEAIDPGTGIRQLRYVVMGEDFHYLLESQVYLNAHLGQIDKNSQTQISSSIFLLDLDLKTPQSPDHLLKTLFKALMGPFGFSAVSAKSVTPVPFGLTRVGMPIRTPPNVLSIMLGQQPMQNLFTTILTLVFQSNMIGFSNFTNSVSGLFPIWSLVQSYSFNPLNEIYTEMLPVLVNGNLRLMPSIVLRPQPYNSQFIKKKLNSVSSSQVFAVLDAPGGIQFSPTLSTSSIERSPGNASAKYAHFYVSKIITNSDIMALDTGKHDRELHNFIFLIQQNTPEGVIAESFALADIAQGSLSNMADLTSIGRQGLRAHISYPVNYFLVKEQIRDANIIMRDRWINAHLYESGTVTIRGSADYIPVGTNLQFYEQQWYAHIEQVSHRFSVDGNGGKTFRTDLTFVRLQDSNGNPVDPVIPQNFTVPEAPPFQNAPLGVKTP